MNAQEIFKKKRKKERTTRRILHDRFWLPSCAVQSLVSSELDETLSLLEASPSLFIARTYLRAIGFSFSRDRFNHLVSSSLSILGNVRLGNPLHDLNGNLLEMSSG